MVSRPELGTSVLRTLETSSPASHAALRRVLERWLQSALEAVNLSKRYGRVWALRGCALAIPAGRIVALIGPHGAGKTTFLQLAVGLLALAVWWVRTRLT